MTRLSVAGGGPTLADQFFARRILTDVALVSAGVAFVALSAQLTILLWPVPVTAQTLAVLLAGTTLGAARGALSLALYAVVGALGLPVFSLGHSGLDSLLGNDGGYIVGFIPAAALAGWLAGRRWDRRILTSFVGLTLAALVPYLFGLPWLSYWLGDNGYPNDVLAVLTSGFFPFLIGDLLKVGVATVLLGLLWRQALKVRTVHPDDSE